MCSKSPEAGRTNTRRSSSIPISAMASVCIGPRTMLLGLVINSIIQPHQPVDIRHHLLLLLQPALRRVAGRNAVAAVMESRAFFDQPDHVARAGALEAEVRHPLLDDIGRYRTFHAASLAVGMH